MITNTTTKDDNKKVTVKFTCTDKDITNDALKKMQLFVTDKARDEAKDENVSYNASSSVHDNNVLVK